MSYLNPPSQKNNSCMLGMPMYHHGLVCFDISMFETNLLDPSEF